MTNFGRAPVFVFYPVYAISQCDACLMRVAAACQILDKLAAISEFILPLSQSQWGPGCSLQ